MVPYVACLSIAGDILSTKYQYQQIMHAYFLFKFPHPFFAFFCFIWVCQTIKETFKDYRVCLVAMIHAVTYMLHNNSCIYLPYPEHIQIHKNLPRIQSCESLLPKYSQHGMGHPPVSQLRQTSINSLALYLKPSLCCVNGKSTCILNKFIWSSCKRNNYTH